MSCELPLRMGPSTLNTQPSTILTVQRYYISPTRLCLLYFSVLYYTLVYFILRHFVRNIHEYNMLAKLIIARMVHVWRRFIYCMTLSACLTENSITYLYGEGKSDYNYDYSYFALSLSSGYIKNKSFYSTVYLPLS